MCYIWYFFPSINNALHEFLEDCNNHPLSSKHNFSLYQLRCFGLSSYQISNLGEFNELSNNDRESFRIYYRSLPPSEEKDNIIVPKIIFSLTYNQVQYSLEVAGLQELEILVRVFSCT